MTPRTIVNRPSQGPAGPRLRKSRTRPPPSLTCFVKLLKLMIAPLAKFIDWSALQMAYAVVGLRHAPKAEWKLEEAVELGRTLSPPQATRRRWNLMGRGISNFPPRPGKVEENTFTAGSIAAERWQERPVVILVDGSFSVGYHTSFPWLARRFNWAGFNVAASDWRVGPQIRP
jgi:hypothetical protein